MADSGLVDAAVIELLANDAQLTALCPDGVYWGVRPIPGGRSFVIVSLFDYIPRPGLADVTLTERTIYLAKAVIQATSRTPARQAAARIHALLQWAVLDLADAGHTAMQCRLIDRVAYPETDAANNAIWHHAGGQYEVTHYVT